MISNVQPRRDMWNIVKNSRVQWIRIVISNSVAQVLWAQSREYGVFEAFCRHGADGSVFSERFEGTEPTVRCFHNVL